MKRYIKPLLFKVIATTCFGFLGSAIPAFSQNNTDKNAIERLRAVDDEEDVEVTPPDGSLRVLSKDEVIARYFDTAKALSEKYYCNGEEAEENNGNRRMVSPKAFNLLLRPVFSNVIVGTNDLVQNTSAASFVQDKDKGTLNINYSRMSNSGIIPNIGAFAKAKDGVFGIYTNNSWNSEIGFSLGVAFPLGSGQFDEPDCQKLKAARKQYLTQTVADYILLIKNWDKANLKADSQRIARRLDITTPDNVVAFQANIDQYKNDKKALKEIDSILKRLNDVYPRYVTADSIKKRLEKDIVTFDTSKGDLFTGYSVTWININGTLSNNTTNASTDKLPEAIKKEFTIKNLAKASVAINFNHNRSREKYIQFFKAGVDFALTNALDQPNVKKQPVLKYDSTTSQYAVYDVEDNFIAAYDDIKANIITIQPALYYSLFFIAEKNIGFDVRSDVKIPIKKSTINYDKTFNITAGPVFRINAKDGYAKGTVGVEVGLIDARFNSHVWKDHFGAKLKIGLPFNVFTKEKTK